MDTQRLYLACVCEYLCTHFIHVVRVGIAPNDEDRIMPVFDTSVR